MQVHQELPSTPPPGNTLLTIGVFDGVHTGHQHLLSRLTTLASDQGMQSGVITFLNHPRSVVIPGTCIQYITSVERRLSLLREQGVDMVIPLTFDMDLAQLRAHDFTRLLQERLNMSGLVMGYNFAMGHRREGNPETLKAIGGEQGFSVTVVDAVSTAGERVSSTTIRGAISDGEIARAAALLGRPFVVEAQVVRGDSRGKTLGFPTANLEVHADRLIPKDGIYASWAHVGDKRYMAATNVGVRPTFGENSRVVEAYLLDYDGDLYGTPLTVEFVRRLRDELRFESAEALVVQMNKDVEQTREILVQSAR